MNTVLITSKEFGCQLDGRHRAEVIELFSKQGWQVVWNHSNGGMSADDIIRLNGENPLSAILVYSSSDQIDQSVFSRCRDLRVISRHGVGVENIDVFAAKQAGVEIRTTAEARGHESVADLTFAMLLSLARKVTVIHANLQMNKWYRPASSDVWGKTLGIVGLGRIGKAVAKRATGFDMRVLSYARHPDKKFVAETGITLCSLEELIAQSDFISLHCALNDETKNMFGKREFSLMKPTAYLINTARSGLVDQSALLGVLKQHRIAGAAIDVFDKEPATGDPLFGEELDNLVATAHVGSYTVDSIRRMDFLAVQNIIQAVS